MDEIIAQYSFLPWLRRGLINHVQTPAAGKQRAELTATVLLNDAASTPVSQLVQLIGPGDIIGINPAAIVRTEPRNWVTNFEPNFLPFVEFYEEDFPWRYTPAAENGQQLNPWLSLAVLEKEEFSRKPVAGSPLTVISIQTDYKNFLPPHNQIWAWAHVHFNNKVNGTGTAPDLTDVEQQLGANPDLAISRLFSPRKLQPNKEYCAFLIPSFENGRLAGLNQPASKNANDPSWQYTEAPKDFPVYYEWFFKTGEVGDFEYLVSLLEPRAVDKTVGIRDMDIQTPGYGIDEVNAPLIVGLEGALVAPDYEPKPLTTISDFPPKLEPIINLQEDLQEAAGDTPIITPPLYGRWHSLVKRLNIDPAEPGWVHNLNKDPRYRVAAGMGTTVVQKNQVDYRRTCWEQLGDVLDAEQKIRFLQLALESDKAIQVKHIDPLPVNTHILITRGVHAKIMGSPVTVRHLIADSLLPLAATDPAFRKLIQPRGKLMRRFADRKTLQPADIIHQLNEGTITAAADVKEQPSLLTPEKAVEGLLPKYPSFLTWLIQHNGWLLFFLLMLAVLFLIAGLWTLAVIAVAAAAGWYFWSSNEKKKINAVQSIVPSNQTTFSIDSIPQNPEFEIAAAGVDPVSSGTTTGSDSATAANYRAALKMLHPHLIERAPAARQKVKLDLPAVSQKIKKEMEPVYAFHKRWLPLIRKGSKAVERIRRIMAYPDIKKPMYEPLRDISTEYLVPNLNLIAPNTITLLQTNQRFIESYMVGLNHEMGRELLWSEFPTDQQGSYFRQFWDVSGFVNVNNTPADQLEEQLRDIKKIHSWQTATELGTHRPGSDGTNKSLLVLVIRGELLKRYPNTVIFAQEATWGKNEMNQTALVLNGSSEFDPANKKLKFPLFSAKIDPDITFIGFDLTKEIVKGDIKEESDAEKNRPGNKPGWFFIIKEVPGEPRFGLDESGTVNSTEADTWNELAWNHLDAGMKTIDLTKPLSIAVPGPIQWGANSADMAYILYQKPMMIAVHARDMLN